MKVTQSLLQLENWTSETNPSEILFLTICSVQVEKVVGVFAKGVQACSDKLLHERESASEKEHGTCKGGEVKRWWMEGSQQALVLCSHTLGGRVRSYFFHLSIRSRLSIWTKLHNMSMQTKTPERSLVAEI